MYPGKLFEDPQTGVIRPENQVALGPRAMVEAGEAANNRRLMRYSIIALRISMGAVYFVFGILKYFPG